MAMTLSELRERRIDGNDKFETERCWLVRLKPEDRQDVAALYQSEDVRRYLGGTVAGRPFDESFSRLLADHEARSLTVRDRRTGGFIGLVTLAPHHDGQDVEVSYQVLPEFWGMGLATEAVGTLVRHALSAFGLPKVLAETQAANRRSRQFLERIGMTAARTVIRFGAEQIVYECRA